LGASQRIRTERPSLGRRLRCKRVRLIQVYKSENVTIRDLHLQRSGFWTVHLCYSRNLNVDGVVIRNNIGGRGPSTDGIDVDSSSEVTIAHADIECNDDAICMKAGRDADGLRVNRPTNRVTVRDCTVRVGAGGFTVGSETSGGIHNISVSGLSVLSGAPRGIIIKSAKTRGGTVDHINIGNVTLNGVATPIDVGLNWNPNYSYAHIPEGMTNVPDYWRVLATPVPADKGLPHVRNVQIANLKATGAKQAFSVNAYPNDPIENFTLSNVDIQAQTAGTIANAQNWTFSNVDIQTTDSTHVTIKDCSGMNGLAPPQPAAK
jgi:polygalacturonase